MPQKGFWGRQRDSWNALEFSTRLKFVAAFLAGLGGIGAFTWGVIVWVIAHERTEDSVSQEARIKFETTVKQLAHPDTAQQSVAITEVELSASRWTDAQVTEAHGVLSELIRRRRGSRNGVVCEYRSELPLDVAKAARLIGKFGRRVPNVIAVLDGADLRNINWDSAGLRHASLQHTCLRGARLRHATLDTALLQGAILDGARLDTASLIGAMLTGTVLNSTQFPGAVLDSANMAGARGRRTNFYKAILTKANLTGATMPEARLNGAQLCRAVLVRTVLHDADFGYADVARADFAGAEMQGVVNFETVRNADLAIIGSAIGLDPGALAQFAEAQQSGAGRASSPANSTKRSLHLPCPSR